MSAELIAKKRDRGGSWQLFWQRIRKAGGFEASGKWPCQPRAYSALSTNYVRLASTVHRSCMYGFSKSKPPRAAFASARAADGFYIAVLRNRANGLAYVQFCSL